MDRRSVRNGKNRTSTTLEKHFWEYLEVIARNHGMERGAFISSLIERAPEKPEKIAPFLREFCFKDAIERANKAEMALARIEAPAPPAADQTLVNELLESLVCPVFQIDQNDFIRWVNIALLEWIGQNHPSASTGVRWQARFRMYEPTVGEIRSLKEWSPGGKRSIRIQYLSPRMQRIGNISIHPAGTHGSKFVVICNSS